MKRRPGHQVWLENVDFNELPVKETVWLSNMLRCGDFTMIAEDEFPPDTYPCALVFGEIGELAAAQVFRLLKADSFIVWDGVVNNYNHWSKLKWEKVVWNILGLKVENALVPFLDNVKPIGVFTKGKPISPCPSPTRVVSANGDGDWLPLPVLHFLLKATSLPGDSILMPTGGPVDRILQLGRRPLCFETDPEKHAKNTVQAKAYYNNRFLDQAEFK